MDALVGAAIEELPRADPPASPLVGTSFVVSSGATGIWAGRAAQIASFTPGGWRYFNPPDGVSVFVKSNGATLRFEGGAWKQILGAQQPAIADAAGGTVVDAEARATIAAMLAALRAHNLVALGRRFRGRRALFATGFEFADPA